MADVWKNMFGAVCSITVQEKLDEKKKEMPAKLAQQKRLVSKLWFDPISYRTFQNALVPNKKGQVSKLGQEFKKRNGAADPLRKTFIIIDEVHKLLDGDLKPSEMADFEKLAAAIQNSYAVSGEDSCRVLLMTATPITDNPEGLFRLLNLLKPSNRLPTVSEFRSKYTTEKGAITAEGAEFFQQKAKGLISYLNREFDPSAFAQPSFISVTVPVSGAVTKSDVELVNECFEAEAWEEEEIDCDVDKIKDEMNAKIAEVDEDDSMDKKAKAAAKKTLKATYKDRVQACKDKISTRKNKLKEYVGKVQTCLTQKSKDRKKAYSHSQQKAVASCFKKTKKSERPIAVTGKPRKFTAVSTLKSMAKHGPIKKYKQANIRNYMVNKTKKNGSKSNRRRVSATRKVKSASPAKNMPIFRPPFMMLSNKAKSV
jgi:hypothetical protein